MSYTTQFTGDDGVVQNFSYEYENPGSAYYNWYDPGNWSNGVPGQFASASVESGDVSVGSLTLYNDNIQVYAQIVGDSIVLNQTLIEGTNNDGEGGGGAVISHDLTINSGSFIGTSADVYFSYLDIDVNYIYNYGVIGSIGYAIGYDNETGIGADDVYRTSNVSGTLFNYGSIEAQQNSYVSIRDETVYQLGSGDIALQSGGHLELLRATTIVNGTIDFGGAAATTLTYDPTISTVQALLASFQGTDVIDLKNFKAVGFVQSGVINPTLLVYDANESWFDPGIKLSFTGNYSLFSFKITPDAAGTGTAISAIYSPVYHPPHPVPHV